jgi:hypothetical protein
MATKRNTRRTSKHVLPQASERQQARHPDTWRPDVAYGAANMADCVADRLVAAVVLLDHVMAPNPGLPKDTGGYVIMEAREIIEQCRQDLREALAAQDSEERGAR